MSDEGSITCWISALRAGNSTAATQLWHRYYKRLVRLAAQKLRGASRRVADEEDVVVDAFDSFCRGARAGRFPKLDDRDDLWQVLVTLTSRKAINQVKHDQREKRGGGRVRGESAFLLAGDQGDGIDQFVGSEPTPEFAALIGDECQRLFELLADNTLSAIAVKKMEGYSNAEIGLHLGILERSVERKLRRIRDLWLGAVAK